MSWMRLGFVEYIFMFTRFDKSDVDKKDLAKWSLMAPNSSEEIGRQCGMSKLLPLIDWENGLPHITAVMGSDDLNTTGLRKHEHKGGDGGVDESIMEETESDLRILRSNEEHENPTHNTVTRNNQLVEWHSWKSGWLLMYITYPWSSC